MSQRKPTPDQAHFGSPVYDIENAPDTLVNRVDTDTDSLPENHIVVETDRQSSYVLIKKVQTNRTSTYTFDIESENTCTYRNGSPDKLPTTVIHALYESGFRILGHNPISHWFQVWLEIRLIRGRIESMNFDVTDALAHSVLESVQQQLECLDELFGARFVAGNYNDYSSLESNGKYGILKQRRPDGSYQPTDFNNIPGKEPYGDPRGTVFDESAPHLLLENPVTEYENIEYFDLTTSDELYPPVGVRTHHSDDNSQLYVDMVTKYNIQRIVFDIDNEESCVPVGDRSINWLSSYVLDAVEEAGYKPKGGINIFTSPSGAELVASCDNKIRAIWNLTHQTDTGKPDSMVDRNLHTLRLNLVTLFTATMLREIMPGRYTKHVETVGKRDNKVELQNKSIHYLMQIHAKSNRSNREDIAKYLPQLNYVEEDIVGSRMESLEETSYNIGILWHAIDDHMHPPKRR